MREGERGDPARSYVRRLLLVDKRNDILTLDEVRRYGEDSFGDPDYVAIYGMQPAEWYSRGVRLLGRTAVECTRDDLADLIGRDVASAARSLPHASDSMLVDPFAGSGNTLFWMRRHLSARGAVGFELDDGVFEASRRNLSIVDPSLTLIHGDYRTHLQAVPASGDRPLIVFVAPPWGDALDEDVGLDLRRTAPPVADVVDFVRDAFDGMPLLFAVQVYERVEPGSLEDLIGRFERTTLRIYDLDAAGRNHGILLGTNGPDP
jgi:hypothetical protein